MVTKTNNNHHIQNQPFCRSLSYIAEYAEFDNGFPSVVTLVTVVTRYFGTPLS